MEFLPHPPKYEDEFYSSRSPATGHCPSLQPVMDRRRSSQPSSTLSASSFGPNNLATNGGTALGPNSLAYQTLAAATMMERDICRICHCEADVDYPLISPCYCAGSLRYVHQGCLQQWIKSSDTRCCELCKFEFIMQTKIKPFRKWEKLEMSPVEQRKVLCSITFHVVAVTCVVWSLYVLIDRTAEEMRSGVLEWPFWTKLIVVAIGFTGGLVFMYVQCKMYAQLFRRWRAFNRIIYVQDAPEKMAMKLADLGPATVTPLNANLVISDASDTVLARSYEKHRGSPVEEFHSCHSGSVGLVSDNRASSGDVRSGAIRGGTNRNKQSPTKMTKSLDDLSSGKPPLLGGGTTGVFQSSVLELSDHKRRGAEPTNHFYTVVLLPEEPNALAGISTGSDASAASRRDYDSTIVRVLESSSLPDQKV